MKFDFSLQTLGKHSNFMKLHPDGAELFNAEGRTDGQAEATKLMIAFCNFANAPKNGNKRGGSQKSHHPHHNWNSF